MVISTSEYDRLLQAQEDAEDLAAADEAMAEIMAGAPTIPWSEVKADPASNDVHGRVFPAAAQSLKKLDAPFGFASPVRSNFSVEPRPPGATMLRGGERGRWRVRVGDHRVVYTIEDQRLIVLVPRIAHRREVYDRRSATSERNTRIAGICRRTTHPCPLETTPSAGENRRTGPVNRNGSSRVILAGPDATEETTASRSNVP